MKQLNIILTDAEYAELISGIEVHNDITTDSINDEVTSIRTDQVDEIVVTDSLVVDLQNEIKAKAEKLAAVRSLCLKLGIKINDNGYTMS